mgnify:FL=1
MIYYIYENIKGTRTHRVPSNIPRTIERRPVNGTSYIY